LDKISTISDTRHAEVYEWRVNQIRILVAIIFAVCGLGGITAAHRIDWLQGVLRQDARSWVIAAWACGIAAQICLISVIGLVIEAILRRCKKRHLSPKEFIPLAVSSIVVYSLLLGCLYLVTDRHPTKGGIAAEKHRLAAESP
jgi:uncharacterized membrane protein YtjA (UPF0391 family)